MCISIGSTKVPENRFCTATLVSVCLSVCQADGWTRATCKNYAYYDDCNPQLVSVVVFLSLLCFRLVILLFYVFIVYLYPCAARCAYSINEIDPLSEYGVVEMPLLRCKNTSTLEVSYRRAALPLDDFFPTERDTFTHIFTYGFGFQFPKVEVSSFKNLVETDRKRTNGRTRPIASPFPLTRSVKKFLQFAKLFLYNTGVHQMARGYSVYVPYPRASVMSQTPYKEP